MTIKLTLRTIGGEATVDAYEHGDFFAIHRSLLAKSWWTLTHIPTGMRCGPDRRTKRECREIGDMLTASGVDWSHEEYEKLTGQDAFLEAARKISNWPTRGRA
ncbi:hypothetical protein GTQ45_02075 [Pyruvatibacter mobilis]|uniref:Uncharacterized protein n=1 Tax=Pyruvatibacter mobilis TaxID=1712261 RepID=A0A845Q807_9HYPH|nr:hypothetical protein [Pyruvatibacter mobilis]NBG94519.1 hypothetical protein [Pyruvatibacter mobilis]QJD74038.1 hypothetical protein HG718_00625 [Pyruvatibacter mobilis]GGD03586.1 hypothetical protein GCM10011587_04150 [Pyruvatibacter mobilis]